MYESALLSLGARPLADVLGALRFELSAQEYRAVLLKSIRRDWGGQLDRIVSQYLESTAVLIDHGAPRHGIEWLVDPFLYSRVAERIASANLHGAYRDGEIHAIELTCNFNLGDAEAPRWVEFLVELDKRFRPQAGYVIFDPMDRQDPRLARLCSIEECVKFARS